MRERERKLKDVDIYSNWKMLKKEISIQRINVKMVSDSFARHSSRRKIFYFVT
jgi:hypothetical protein